MHKTLFAVLAASLFSGCVATATTGSRPPPPPREEVRVVEPPHHEHRPPPPPREPRVIEGVVLDAATHQPIDRAAIDVRPRATGVEVTVQTGPDGRFRTQELPPGEFQIRCRRDGFLASDSSGSMPDGKVRVNFELRRR
jgi:Carboxypeptidase regulatory-like domain